MTASQSPVRVGCPETPARTVQLSSVAPERVSEPTHTRLGGAATLAPATHKKRGSAGYPTGRRVTLGGAQCACVANAPAAQLPSCSEPSCDRLGQLSRAEGDTARDAVPAPPGRGAGAHDLDPRGPQHDPLIPRPAVVGVPGLPATLNGVPPCGYEPRLRGVAS